MVKSIFVLLIFGINSLVFLYKGCLADTEEKKKQAFENYQGKWRLAESINPSDIGIIGSGWIELHSDSTFSSSSSIMWRDDSLRLEPFQGRWSSYYILVSKYDPGTSGPGIVLKVDGRSKYWRVSGQGTKDGKMIWSDQFSGQIYYRWT
jgi:hypothetical protein